MSREVALRLIEIFHNVAKRSDVDSSWEEDIPNGLVAMEAALAALEAGDEVGSGIYVYDIPSAGEYLVAEKLQPKLRETAETVREQCAEKIESLIKEKQPGPNPRETNVPILDWPDELRALEI